MYIYVFVGWQLFCSSGQTPVFEFATVLCCQIFVTSITVIRTVYEITVLFAPD